MAPLQCRSSGRVQRESLLRIRLFLPGSKSSRGVVAVGALTETFRGKRSDRVRTYTRTLSQVIDIARLMQHTRWHKSSQTVCSRVRHSCSRFALREITIRSNQLRWVASRASGSRIRSAPGGRTNSSDVFELRWLRDLARSPGAATSRPQATA